MFIPFHNPSAAIASVFYCNELSTLSAFLKDASTGELFRNEMELLANWATRNKSLIFALPTMASVLLGPETPSPDGVEVIQLSQTSGVVDAAQLGQWIAGIDPRNISPKTIPRTKFVDAPSKYLLNVENFQSIEFSTNFQKKELIATINGRKIRVYNLHLHSKIHDYLAKSDSRLDKILSLSNLEVANQIPGTRKMQISYHFLLALNLLRNNPKKFITEIIWRCNFLMKRRPSSYPFISGDTFRNIANHHWENENKQLSPKDVKQGDIVFCQAELFSELRDQVLVHIEAPITLLLGNSDLNQTKHVHANISSLKVAKIFAQNLADPISKFDVLPIGLENLWRHNYGKIPKKIIRNATAEYKDYRIMWGFSLQTNFEMRSAASAALSRCEVAKKMELSSNRRHQQALSRFAFVASPPGNGLDTHRTWEAMYLKCIPIVIRSHMTERFFNLGLPIWVVDSYDDIVHFSENDLKQKYRELSSRFETEAIWAQYWIDRINSKD
jgi:hypothetical protein